MGILIKKSGLLTSVQDLGRFGYQQNGIIVSGVMDSLSMRLANLLVGNSVTEAVLEVTLIGPSILFLVDSIIAISGGDLSPTINHIQISLNKPIIVKKGDQLDFGTIKNGSRSYVAFRGGLPLEKVLGSRSTCLPGKFGGFCGKALEKGDVLPLKPIQLNDTVKINWKLSNYFSKMLVDPKPIRFIRGRQYDLFNKDSLELFASSSFMITKDSNRMGYRLKGPELSLLKQEEILTEGVTFGSIQVPANGQPIILMADRQTTGGYPKIAQVISVDLPRLAQLKPGDYILFSEITLLEAQKLVINRENEIRALQKVILAKWKGSEV